jgi:hypothetical protein
LFSLEAIIPFLPSLVSAVFGAFLSPLFQILMQTGKKAAKEKKQTKERNGQKHQPNGKRSLLAHRQA